jgi:predicted nucleotidyltransferase
MGTDVSDEIVAAVVRAIGEMERRHGITALYAVESGSRAWGFASAGSDYDVRFLYAHPPDAYLRLDDPPDTVRLMEERAIGGATELLDIEGWDVRKALRALRTKSNPVVVEWLHAPIVYLEASRHLPALRQVADEHARRAALHFHYMNMARSNYVQYVRNPAAAGRLVRRKKYLYVLRPLTNVLYLEQTGGRIPPTAFGEAWALVQQRLPPAMVAAVAELLAAKRAGDELGETDPIPALDAWIAETFAAQEARAAAPGFAARLEDGAHGGAAESASFTAALDGLLVAMVHEAAGRADGERADGERGEAGRPKEQWHDESGDGPGA